jgi:hypothetical protein
MVVTWATLMVSLIALFGGTAAQTRLSLGRRLSLDLSIKNVLYRFFQQGKAGSQLQQWVGDQIVFFFRLNEASCEDTPGIDAGIDEVDGEPSMRHAHLDTKA